MSFAEQSATADNNDRLPWLEGDDDYRTDEEGISIGRLIMAVIVGLAAIGLIVGGVFWLRNRVASGVDDRLITAPSGAYKEKPQNPGGMEVEGTGDVAYQTSQGSDVNSRIDLTRVPEAPVAAPLGEVGPKAPDADAVTTTALKPSTKPGVAREAAKPANPSVANIATAPRREPAKPAAPVATPAAAPKAAASGAAAQLGAFSSRSGAETAWKSLSGRFTYLAGLNHSVEPVEVNGRTLHRLRVSGADVSTVCAKMKVAGEVCNIVR